MHFTHQHRRYRLFKRSSEPGAPYYLGFEDRGERILRSTGHADTRQATRWARSFLDARAGQNAAALSLLVKRPGGITYSTVGKVLTWFETSSAVDLGADTRTSYLNCMRLVLRTTHPEDDIDKLPASVWGKSLVLAWVEAKTAQCAGADDETAARIKRSANSILNQAKSIFSLLTIEHAKRAGLILPDFGEFLTACKLYSFRRCDKEDWHPPTDQVITTTLDAWRALLPAVGPVDPDARNAYAAIWLALSCGLRLGEIAQARWEWITEANGRPLLLGTTAGLRVKDGTGRLRVTPLDPFWSEGLAEVKARTPDRTGTEFILAGTVTARRDWAFRAVSDLMRRCGWRTSKAAHALRALAGSWVAARFGVYQAQQFLRHASVTTTEQHYSVLLRDSTFRPFAVGWAGNLNEKSSHGAGRKE